MTIIYIFSLILGHFLRILLKQSVKCYWKVYIVFLIHLLPKIITKSEKGVRKDEIRQLSLCTACVGWLVVGLKADCLTKDLGL